MDRRSRVAMGVTIVAAVFLAVQLGALALVEPFQASYQPVEDPQDPTNALFYVGAILVATAFMLAAFKLGVDQLIRLLIVGSGAWLSLYVFQVVVPDVAGASYGGLNLVAVGLAVLLGVALYVHPEWYVIDAAGAVMGAAAAGLFGISFGIFPALLLLTVLAVYDAISVYGTEHMLTLASGVMDLKVPVVLVIPLSPTYSFLDAGTPDPTDGEADGPADESASEPAPPSENGETPESAAGETPGDEPAADDPLSRDALFIGLGDAVIPTVLVASAAFFAPDGVPVPLGIPLPALTAMVGTFAGLTVLLWMVLKGRAHAGLPLLNGGAIAGYVLGALASGLTLVQTLGIGGYV